MFAVGIGILLYFFACTVMGDLFYSYEQGWPIYKAAILIGGDIMLLATALYFLYGCTNE